MKMNVKESRSLRAFSERLIASRDRPCIICAVHLCGTLSLRAVQIFNASLRAHALALVPCCMPPKEHADWGAVYRVGCHKFDAAGVRDESRFPTAAARFRAWAEHVAEAVDPGEAGEKQLEEIIVGTSTPHAGAYSQDLFIFAQRAAWDLLPRPPPSEEATAAGAPVMVEARWLRPALGTAEPTLAASPLRGGGLPGPFASLYAGAGWVAVVHDELRRSFVSQRQRAFPEETLHEWWDLLSQRIHWSRSRSKVVDLPRSTSWLTRDGCTCDYDYGGRSFKPVPMEAWLENITESVCRVCGLKDLPNSCVPNYYEDGDQVVSWHSDDELLFDASRNDALVMSISLGCTRTLELRPHDAQKQVSKVRLRNGDLFMMEGLCQKHYQHRIPREKDASGPRISLTWRWIINHRSDCGSHV